MCCLPFWYRIRRNDFVVGRVLRQKGLEVSEPHGIPSSFSVLSTCSRSEISVVSATLMAN